jgi:hypothetical protein
MGIATPHAGILRGSSPPPAAGLTAAWLRWSAIALSLTSLASALLFGLYILAFYAAAAAQGRMERWNTLLPRLYEADTPVATLGMGLHFAAGGVILVLGGVQLLAGLRARYPAVHRWTGRVYVGASLLAGVGGLVFIALKGTVGGWPMDLGFGLYGALTVLAAVQTWRHARARRLDAHRAWALRLFALAIGSWLFRMENGFWRMLTGGIGHTKDFSGPFDVVMAFFFYVPNLLVVEAWLRAQRLQAPAWLRALAALLLTGATGFVALGTYYFTRRYWGPAILQWVTG